ncbi:hypothetical protein MTR67_011567, partial [Solanum verrucosum]
MVADMRSMRSLFVVGLTRLSSKESKASMLIGYMGIARLMIHVQQHKQKGPAPLSASAPAPRNKCEYNNQNSQNLPAHSQGSKAQGGTKTPACAKCGRSHSVAPPDRVASRCATLGAGGEGNHLYAITSRREQEDSPDVVTGMI